MKTCVTCAFKHGSYCTKQWMDPPRIDPVTGSKIGGTHFNCSTQRSFEGGSCGESGKWWSPNSVALTWRGQENAYKRNLNIFQRAVLRLLSVFRN